MSYETTRYEPLDTWEKGDINYHTIDEIVIAELEKIKAEIDEPMRDTTDSYGRGYACAMFKCLDILDNHIKELKGENNE